MNKTRLIAQLKQDEGIRLKPYRDTQGKLSIGIGRNLDDVGITLAESLLLLEHDIDKALFLTKKLISNFSQLDNLRQEVLVNMMFNMGYGTFCTFQHFLAAVQQNNFKLASKEMLASLWANQVGKRAQRLANAMLTGGE